MTELDIETLKRRYPPSVLLDIERNPHNAGAKEVRELVRLVAIGYAVLEDRERLRAAAWAASDATCPCPWKALEAALEGRDD